MKPKKCDAKPKRYFRKWRNDGTWAKLNDVLRTQVRHHHKKRPKSPSMGIIDSQSVKTTEQGGPGARTPTRWSPGRSGS